MGMHNPMPTVPTQALLAHADFLRSLALSMVGREDLAEDLLQDVWVTALTSPPRASWDPRRWLSGVARNIAKQRTREAGRRRRRESRAAQPESLPATGDSVARLDQMHRVVDAVQSLDAPYRDVVVLRFFDALPPREIASRLSIPVETVRTRQRRALEQLRSRLDATHGDRATWTAALLPLTGPFTATTAASSSLTGTTLLIMKTKFLLAGLVLIAVVLSVMYAIPSEATHSADPVERTPTTAMVAANRNDTTAPQPDAPESRQAVVVEETLRIHGDVLRSRTETLSGARVRIRLWNGYVAEGQPAVSAEVTTDAQGRFEWLTPRPENTVRIEVSSSPRQMIASKREILVVAGRDPDRVRLGCYELDCEVTGRVTETDGAPIGGALVTLFRQTAATKKDGTYRVRGSTAFSGVTAEVYARGFILSNQTIKPQRDGVRNVDFQLRRGFTVSGRVTTVDGAPVVGARFYESWRTQDREGITDQDGHYTLTCLTPAQEVHLTVIHAELLSSRAAIKGGDGPTTRNFVLQRGLSIRGVVVDIDGTPVPGAELELYTDPESGSPERRAFARDNGRFEMRGVEPGNKKIMTTLRGFASLSTKIQLSDGTAKFEEARIELHRGHTLRGSVTDLDQNLIPNATLYVTGGRNQHSLASLGSPTRTDSKGRFRIPDLPPGPVTVRATRRGFLDAHKVVERTADADISISLKPSGRLAGLVTDKVTGAPVTDFRVRFVAPLTREGERQGSGYNAIWSSTGTAFSSQAGAWDTGTATLEPGTVFGIEIKAAGYAVYVEPRVVASTNPTPVVTALERGRALEGTVVSASDGQPITGAVVRVLTPNATAHSRAETTAEGLSPRRHG